MYIYVMFYIKDKVEIILEYYTNIICLESFILILLLC